VHRKKGLGSRKGEILEKKCQSSRELYEEKNKIACTLANWKKKRGGGRQKKKGKRQQQEENRRRKKKNKTTGGKGEREGPGRAEGKGRQKKKTRIIIQKTRVRTGEKGANI